MTNKLLYSKSDAAETLSLSIAAIERLIDDGTLKQFSSLVRN